MTLDRAKARELLAKADFRRLFVEELGWDTFNSVLRVETGNVCRDLTAVAQKRGMACYRCPTPPGENFPDLAERRKIERQVTKSTHEHILIFTDSTEENQIWQWVRRGPGKPAACREHRYNNSGSGDALLQKLEAIAFTFDEEERITLPDVTKRARKAFDVERVTKRFYDHFQKEHAAFLGFIQGIADTADREWYASLTLNRLMFVYFIQRKGFLDGDMDYLRNRLNRLREEHGRDQFYSFYRYFLLRLFHEGLGGRDRTPELDGLIGRIPYLNGGLFDIHELERPERYGDSIAISDEAFERVFDFFDQYQWHLDERPLRDDNEINPDVLGYIFEKYINQKQMGAYYTKEDITEYIAKNTVIPFLFDAARAKCRTAFENPGGPTVWDLLKTDPDRYIYKAVRHGVTWNYAASRPDQGEALQQPYELPEDIAAGVNPPTLHDTVGEVTSINDIETIRLRKNWNTPAPPTHGLPTETWREVVGRRTRYEEIRAKLRAGEICDISNLVTLNLDIRQFAQDVLENCESPELLRAFWRALEKITILDPTCGSGAFLFAALNILEPLYEACLDRMEAFVADLDRSQCKRRPEKFSDFRTVLDHVAAHPNERYFILKSIILNNLYGVDIMEEAVEICKLRLFLKLAAQVEPDTSRPNLGIEPLPDIDFNVKAGNTLVGFATFKDVEKAIKGDVQETLAMFDDEMDVISRKAADLRQAFDAFRARQIEGDASVPAEHKQELQKRLADLNEELSRYLAKQYGIEEGAFPKSKKKYQEAYAKWLRSHRPFHWFVEFYGIVHEHGGFDVIIGNPPWKEYSSVKKDYAVQNYAVEKSGNLYALCTERAVQLGVNSGTLSFIVQLPFVSSSRMLSLRKYLSQNSDRMVLVPFDDRPGKLFEELQNCRSCIFIIKKSIKFSTQISAISKYKRWQSFTRDCLFNNLNFTIINSKYVDQGIFPKLDTLHSGIFLKLYGVNKININTNYQKSEVFIFYQESTRYWVKATVGLPYYAKNGTIAAPAHGRYLYFDNIDAAHITCALINSSIFYSYFITLGDCFHLSDSIVANFPVASEVMNDAKLINLNIQLSLFLESISGRKTIVTKDGDNITYDEFNVSASKPIIDEIDCVLARCYGFTEEELDFIVNYDIKYRMGRDSETENGEK